MQIGETIHALRVAAKLSVADLSRKSGIMPRMIYAWESGQRRPNLSNAKALADALEVTVDRLVEGSDGFRPWPDGGAGTGEADTGWV